VDRKNASSLLTTGKDGTKVGGNKIERIARGRRGVSEEASVSSQNNKGPHKEHEDGTKNRWSANERGLSKVRKNQD